MKKQVERIRIVSQVNLHITSGDIAQHDGSGCSVRIQCFFRLVVWFNHEENPSISLNCFEPSNYQDQEMCWGTNSTHSRRRFQCGSVDINEPRVNKMVEFPRIDDSGKTNQHRSIFSTRSQKDIQMSSFFSLPFFVDSDRINSHVGPSHSF